LKGFASNKGRNFQKKRNGWQRFACQPFCLSAPNGQRRYHACLAVPAASVTTAATVKPATAAVKATTTVETAAAMESATTAMESATMEATAMEAFTAESTTVETLATEAATKAAIEATATVEAAMKAAIKEPISVPEAKAPPGSGADEDAALKPVRAVIAVGGAGVRIIIVVTISAGGWAVIDRPSKSNAEGDALGVRVRSREETDTESNAE
jgi:hypothetical protein